MDNEPLQQCQNCLKEFPESKMPTHFGYCRRNIKKCPQCHEMFDINFKEQHDEQYHKQQACPHCSISFSTAEIKSHEKNCAKKPKYCEYCDLNVPINTYPTHLKACQSRTKPCTKCNVPITNKDYYLHVISCEGPKEEVKPTRNYQEHIQQQRRVIEQNAPNLQKMNSREKAYGYPYQPKNVQNKEIVSNVDRRINQAPKIITYIPPPRQEIKVDDKRDYLRQQQQPQPRIDPKKQQIRKIPNSVNPPTHYNNNAKKEELRAVGRISNQIPGPSTQILETKGTSNRQPMKQNIRGRQQPVSNKDLFPTHGTAKGVSLKEGKSVERQFGKIQINRKEQIPPNLSNLPANYNQRNKPAENKPKAAYQDRYQEPSHEYLNQNHNPSEIYGVEQDQQMQMAIMQSLGQREKGLNGNRGSYVFQNEMMSESFIAQQRMIQAELKNKRKR